MSSVKSIVKDCLIYYPGMFESRNQVLHFALCVGGNGYVWNRKGEMQHAYRGDKETPYRNESKEIRRHRKEHKEYQTSFDSGLEASLRLRIRAENARADFNRKNMGLLLKERFSKIDHLYPMWDSVPLANIPDNITADWKDAIQDLLIQIDTGFTNLTITRTTKEKKRMKAIIISAHNAVFPTDYHEAKKEIIKALGEIIKPHKPKKKKP